MQNPEQAAQKAHKLFRGEERYNCAQTVLATFAGEMDGANQEAIAAMRSSGGGRAQGGLCGALHAAKTLVPQEQVETDFVKQSGSLFCREIRKLNRLSCRECAKLAARLVVEHRDKEVVAEE